MTALQTDTAIARAHMRAHMVDSQVRPNQVSDARVIAAMRWLPREAFAPPGSLAYSDADIPLGDGRYLLPPMVIGRLTQLVLAANPKKILVIAAGAGYGAAILSAAGAEVVALEADPALDTGALASFAPAVKCETGKLADGWAAAAPYDAIFIEGAVVEMPAQLAAQLAPGGRLVTILADSAARHSLGRAVIAVASGGRFAESKVFDCTARILPEFQPAPEFVF